MEQTTEDKILARLERLERQEETTLHRQELIQQKQERIQWVWIVIVVAASVLATAISLTWILAKEISDNAVRIEQINVEQNKRIEEYNTEQNLRMEQYFSKQNAQVRAELSEQDKSIAVLKSAHPR